MTNPHRLPSGYIPRLDPVYFVDDLTGDGIVHQPDVYAFAAHIAEHYDAKHLIDIGCGRAGKLVAFRERFGLVGLDHGANIDWCREHADLGQAIDWDLERDAPLPLSDELAVADAVVICADVLEHLVEPGPLIRNLQRLARVARAVVVTTPERELVRGAGDIGPPLNPAHVREWTLAELEALLGEAAPLAFAGLTRNNDRDNLKRTSLVCLDPRGVRPAPAPGGFDVLAVICAYNEEDVIGEVVRQLLAEGVRVHLIDNWSQDATLDRVEALGAQDRVTLELHPAEGPTGVYAWRHLLRRVEQVAAASRADWVVHHDADELRSAPWPGVGLRDALYRIQACGFNAADHTLLQFRPVDEAPPTSFGLGERFGFFEFGDRPGHFLQIKAWRRRDDVSLAASGGHEAVFAQRSVFPYNLLTRHYPLRSVEQARRKIFAERRPRWDTTEREQGWHVQYDGFDEASRFVWSRDELLAYDPATFPREYLTERLTGVGVQRSDDLGGARQRPDC